MATGLRHSNLVSPFTRISGVESAAVLALQVGYAVLQNKPGYASQAIPCRENQSEDLHPGNKHKKLLAFLLIANSITFTPTLPLERVAVTAAVMRY